MPALSRALKIRPGEHRTAVPLVAMMLVAWAGAAIGSTGAESLFFARFGPQALPTLYVLLGLVTFPTILGMTALLSSRMRGLATVLLALGVLLIPTRLALELDFRLFYAVLWLLMMVVWVSQGMALWGVAGSVSDARQAKRLFPLYGAAMILGGAVGGLATRPLSEWIGAENFLVVWAVSLILAFWLARSVLDRSLKRAAGRRVRSPVGDMAESLRFLRGSRLLVFMAAALVLFSMLYLTLTLPFARAVTQRFPDADRLAAFLGVFFGLMNAAALLLSLFAVNRLFARFGVATMVLVLPVIYLLGFGILAIVSTFAALVVFRFVQLLWVYAVWSPGWEALFNVVPADRRAAIRTMMEAGPRQAGAVAAGVVLIAADHVLAPRHVFVIGVAAAALAVFLAWRARQSYRDAVIQSLRAGWPDVFIAEEHPFGGFQQDATALEALLVAASDADPRLRRIALEILSDVQSPAAEPPLRAAVSDPDPEIRAVALQALARRKIPAVAEQVRPLLTDRDPTVRAWAVRAAGVCGWTSSDIAAHVGPLLSDPDATVRATAAVMLSSKDADPRARPALEAMARDPRPDSRAVVLEALDSGDGFESDLARTGLADPDPVVRRAAVLALGRLEGDRAAEWLVQALDDDELAVREAVGQALRHARLTDQAPVRRYADEQRDLALRYHRLWMSVDAETDDRISLAADSLRHRSLNHARSALQAMALFTDREAFEVALDNLESRDRDQIAGALETLETVGEPEVVRPLLPLWETSNGAKRDTSAVLRTMLSDDDPWLRACAAMAGRSITDPSLSTLIEEAARNDPDPTVRETASWARQGGEPMETVTTLPLMERLLFLRKVPLFAELSPKDLKHVAEVVAERAFPDGSTIAEAGEWGDEMHVVVSGEIRVVMGGEAGQSEIARRRPGDYVGEMSIITGEPRMASLVAAGDVRTLSIDRKRFERILLERPQASLAVMRGLCLRLQEAHRQAAPAASPG
ncbi:MAG: HEAT repeat domain-containing protein [Actinomycetota bacterium]|nr:HEAT repeat domain-containing protein [Actinomycetota bacterium]